MNPSHRIGLACGLAFLLPAAALAEPLDVKTGQWESTMTLETSGAPPIDLSQLPPERRARMEAALKKQQAQGPHKSTRVTKSCVTQEELSRMPFQDFEKSMEVQGESCKRTVIAATSRRWREKMECSGKLAITAELSVEALSRESAKGNVTSLARGKDHSMSTKAAFTARWVSAACEKK
jgi:Protein of unknown function (DUF3617)